MFEPYPKEVTDLLTIEGFMNKFYQYLQDKSNSEAYEDTEKEYEKYFRKRRFASYEVFKVIKRRYLTKSK